MEDECSELKETMQRIEACRDAKQGRMSVRGTVLAEGEEIIRTSLDGTTTQALIRSMEDMRSLCNTFVREQILSDRVNFIRIDYKENTLKDVHQQIVMGVEDAFKAIVVQEYEIRDLRVRPKEAKDAQEYKFFQQNPFFPSLDKPSS